jgi:hypothetical protein
MIPEFHKLDDGGYFTFKNFRFEIEGELLVFKADIGGDQDAGQKYLEENAKLVWEAINAE